MDAIFRHLKKCIIAEITYPYDMKLKGNNYKSTKKSIVKKVSEMERSKKK